MLIPIMGSREHRAALVPDDLLRVQQADPQKAVQNFAREDGRVPDVYNLLARHQFEGFRPIGARVPRDGRLGVAFGTVLHIAGRCRTTTV